jgi:hypothetical protein
MPRVANANIILVFWSRMMCRTLVYELGHDQPSTTKELLDIATRHASSKEAVGAAFILGNVKAGGGGSHATPPKATNEGSKKGANDGRKG